MSKIEFHSLIQFCDLQSGFSMNRKSSNSAGIAVGLGPMREEVMPAVSR